MTPAEFGELEVAIERMTDIAKGFGLDFYDMRFELVPADVLYTFGAYQGMPTRFSHWSFGKAYHRMKMDYDFGLSRIYELVINSDPCYAFLMDSNSLVQNKLVSAHVLAHCDFFKNNAMFARTSRGVVDSMAASAERFRSYEMEYGKDAVEEFLDAALAVQEHVDASHTSLRRQLKRSEKDGETQRQLSRERGPYEDLFELDIRSADAARAAEKGQQSDEPASGKRAIQTEKDLLLFLVHHSKVLSDWQRDILTVVREEMLYFWPQIETKIMNEGWATYWHLRIMRELPLTDADSLDFARMHSGVVLPSKTSVNPYTLGLKMWEEIEKRWDRMRSEADSAANVAPSGREKMFEVREMESDTSFIRNYLTKELVDELDLYLYQKVGNEWRVVEQDFEKVRDKLCASRVNGGYPVLLVRDGDYQLTGELYLFHAYEGMELDVRYTEKTLPYVHRLWGRSVHLETVLEGRPVLFTYDGKKTSRKFL